MGKTDKGGIGAPENPRTVPGPHSGPKRHSKTAKGLFLHRGYEIPTNHPEFVFSFIMTRKRVIKTRFLVIARGGLEPSTPRV